MILIDNILGSYTLLTRLDGDGHTVLVATTNRDDISTALTQITNIDIRGHIYTRQMADMHRAIGIRKCRCYQITLKLFLHFS